MRRKHVVRRLELQPRNVPTCSGRCVPVWPESGLDYAHTKSFSKHDFATQQNTFSDAE